MGNYGSLNVLANKKIKDFMSDDAIQDVANMIAASGANRSQRKRLERALRKTENIQKHAQAHLDNRAYKEYQEVSEDHMRRFFSILGIVLKKNYNFEESEDKEDISEMFNLLNAYLMEYQDMSTEEIAQICYEVTGIQLIAE